MWDRFPGIDDLLLEFIEKTIVLLSLFFVRCDLFLNVLAFVSHYIDNYITTAGFDQPLSPTVYHSINLINLYQFRTISKYSNIIWSTYFGVGLDEY